MEILAIAGEGQAQPDPEPAIVAEAAARPAPGRTVSHRLEQVEMAVTGMRQDIDGLRADVYQVSRASEWVVESITQLLQAGGHQFTPFQEDFTYRRRTRARRDGANTSHSQP